MGARSDTTSHASVLRRVLPATGGPGALHFLGLTGALVYLLAFTVPYWLPTHYLHVQDELFAFAAREPWRGVLFYAGLAVLFGLYGVALGTASRLERSGKAAAGIGLWTLIYCLILIPMQPLTSSDVYGYVFQGRIVSVLHQNPFTHLYREFAADPCYFLVTFHNLPASTGYGPLWIAIEAALGWLSQERILLNLLLFKGLSASFHLSSALLVLAILRHEAPGRRLSGMALYAWNPLLLLELVGNVHNDAAVAALALLGLLFLSRGRWWAGIPGLAAAALVKPVALLWLPVAAMWLLAPLGGWPARLRRAGAIGALALVPAVAAYAPFWDGAATFGGLVAQSDISGNSLPNLLIQALWSLWPDARAEVVASVKAAAALCFLPFYLYQLRVARSDLYRASHDVVLFYLLFVGLQFMPWYLAWLVVPAALLTGPADRVRRDVTLALCVFAPLLYFPFGWRWARGTLGVAAIAALAALPILAVAAVLAARCVRARRRVRHRQDG